MAFVGDLRTNGRAGIPARGNVQNFARKNEAHLGLAPRGRAHGRGSATARSSAEPIPGAIVKRELAPVPGSKGSAPRHHERIFEMLQRLHGQREYPGTGIGLAVCRRVALRHGGRIRVESETGHGSAFHFTLPRAQEPSS